jgi:nitroreductase
MDYRRMTDPNYKPDDPRGEQAPRVRDSAYYLADHFHEVPLMVIPLFAGRLDGLSVAHAAGSWGSILPSVWSFMLALRERGLGSAWTTMHLGEEQHVAEILGIPYERYTQVGLFPVAYSKGTDFKPTERVALERVLHWDTW